MTSILTSILRVDHDDDFQISPKELKEALFRLNMMNADISTMAVQQIFLGKSHQNVSTLLQSVHESMKLPPIV